MWSNSNSSVGQGKYNCPVASLMFDSCSLITSEGHSELMSGWGISGTFGLSFYQTKAYTIRNTAVVTKPGGVGLGC